MNTDNLTCIYTRGALDIISILTDTGAGLFCPYSKKTAAQLLADNPGAELMPFDSAVDLIELAQTDKYCTGWHEITEARFMDALECLPPEKWTQHPLGEAFHVSERITGLLVDWYARIGERYFSMCEKCTMKPADVIASAAAFATAEQSAQVQA